eukprot:6065372-Amphidinium_carterae.1
MVVVSTPHNIPDQQYFEMHAIDPELHRLLQPFIPPDNALSILAANRNPPLLARGGALDSVLGVTQDVDSCTTLHQHPF